MTKQFRLLAMFLIGAVFLAGVPVQLEARPSDIQLRWEELSALAVGREVIIKLPDSTKVQGELLAVRDDGLSVDVSKTSNKHLHPKGQVTIPRKSLTTLQMLKLKRVQGRVVGTTLGVLGGLFASGLLIGACWEGNCNGGALAVGTIGVGAGVTILGNRLGHRTDIERTTIRIIQ